LPLELQSKKTIDANNVMVVLSTSACWLYLAINSTAYANNVIIIVGFIDHQSLVVSMPHVVRRLMSVQIFTSLLLLSMS